MYPLKILKLPIALISFRIDARLVHVLACCAMHSVSDATTRLKQRAGVTMRKDLLLTAKQGTALTMPETVSLDAFVHRSSKRQAKFCLQHYLISIRPSVQHSCNCSKSRPNEAPFSNRKQTHSLHQSVSGPCPWERAAPAIPTRKIVVNTQDRGKTQTKPLGIGWRQESGSGHIRWWVLRFS